MAALVGYARTSTAEQDAGLEAQIRDLKLVGCVKIFSEKVSSVVGFQPHASSQIALGRFLAYNCLATTTERSLLARPVPRRS